MKIRENHRLLRAAGAAAFLLSVAAPAFATDGWLGVFYFILYSGCTILLLGVVLALINRTAALVVFFLFGFPAGWWAWRICAEQTADLWEPFLWCFLALILACAFTIFRRRRSVFQDVANWAKGWPIAVTRIVIAILLLPIFVLAVGWTYQRVAEHLDNRAYPPPGKLYRVNGRLMHIHCQGSGSPTIIVEQGIGGPSQDWDPINEQMAKITRVCDYDRAGMGYSEPAYKPARANEVAINLHALLDAANLDDDIIIVGWSAGGMYAREYYLRFPERVKGLVLVDSPHEQTLQRMPAQPSNKAHLDSLMRKHYLAQFGWVRLSGEIEGQYAESSLPEQDRKRLIAFFLKSHAYRTLVDEGTGLELDLAMGKNAPGLGNVPLVVIAEGAPRHPYMKENLGQWHELQRQLAALSTDGRFVVAENSAHFIHKTEPEVILKAVTDVVEAARTGRRLSAQEVPATNSTPRELVESFLAWEERVKPSGVNRGSENDELKTLLSTELLCLFNAAVTANEIAKRRAPDEKPPFVEGNLFLPSAWDRPAARAFIASKEDGRNAEVVVEFKYEPPSNFSSKYLLRRVDDTWRIADIMRGGTCDFCQSGSLLASLYETLGYFPTSGAASCRASK